MSFSKTYDAMNQRVLSPLDRRVWRAPTWPTAATMFAHEAHHAGKS
jgi:hypothetical protein